MSDDAKVTFEAQLVAMGEPCGIDLDQLDYEDAVVLVFIATVDEARKIAPLFRQMSKLTGEKVTP